MNTRAELALGTAQFGSHYGIANRSGSPSRTRALEILEAATLAGVRYIDTASGYGEAESIIGDFLQTASSAQLRVSTKLSAPPSDLSAHDLGRHVVEAIERSRDRLRVEQIDTLLLHTADAISTSGTALVDALARCLESGIAARVGVSVYRPSEAQAALAYASLSAIQFPFNVFDRRLRDTGVTSRLTEARYTMFARSALLQGLLAMDRPSVANAVPAATDWISQFHDICRTHEVEPTATAIAYAAAQSGADFVILGVETPGQMRDAAVAATLPLEAGLIDALDDAFASVPSDIIDPRRWEHRPNE